jgi:hypothetical protein
VIDEHLSPAFGTPDEVGDMLRGALVVQVGHVASPVDICHNIDILATAAGFWLKPTQALSAAWAKAQRLYGPFL